MNLFLYLIGFIVVIGLFIYVNGLDQRKKFNSVLFYAVSIFGLFYFAGYYAFFE